MSNEAKLGLFVIAVVVVFFFFTINMGGGLFQGQETKYLVYFDNIDNLEVGSPVKQAGLQVGEVQALSFRAIGDVTRTIYAVASISVNDSALISSNSQATIGTMGLMGEQYIEITFGDGEPAEPGTPISGVEPSNLDDAITKATELIESLLVTVDSLNNIIGQDELQVNITRLVANLQTFSEDLNNIMGDEQERLTQITQNLVSASANLQSLMTTAEITIADVQGMVRDTGDDVRVIVSNTRDITDSLRGTFVDDLQTISADLKSFSHQLNASMSRADGMITSISDTVSETRPDIRAFSQNLVSISENVNRTSVRVDEIVDAIQSRNGLLNTVIYDEDVALSAKSTITNVSGVLRGLGEIPERFSYSASLRYFPDELRFDPDDSHFRADMLIRYEFTDYLHLYAGGSNLGTENTFDAQFGYTTGPVTFRGGVIESEIGFGIDWQVLDRWMLGLQAVGVTDDNKERLDLLTEILVHDPFYLMGGIQDFTDEVYPYGGVKVRF